MLMVSPRTFTLGGLASALPQRSWAENNEIRVICSGGFTAAYNILAPRFEQVTGKKSLAPMARPWATRPMPFRSALRGASRPTSSFLRALPSTSLRRKVLFGPKAVSISPNPASASRCAQGLRIHPERVRHRGHRPGRELIRWQQRWRGQRRLLLQPPSPIRRVPAGSTSQPSFTRNWASRPR